MSLAEELHQQQPFHSASQAGLIGLLRTAAVIRHRLEQMFQAHGMSAQQYNVLRILRGAGQPLPTMDIAQRLIEPTPGITRLLARMERDGLIKRQRDQADRRQVKAAMTTTGRDMLDQLADVVAEVDQLLATVLDHSELEQLNHHLDTIRDCFRS